MGHVAGFTPYGAGLPLTSVTSRPVRGPEVLEERGPRGREGAATDGTGHCWSPCCCGGDVEALKMGAGSG